jgi:ankyrin repeat protein
MCKTDGWGALHFCAWLNHLEIAQFLINAGANVNLQNHWEQVSSTVISGIGC